MTDKVTATQGGSTDPAPNSRRRITGKHRHTARIALAASTAAVALIATAGAANAAGVGTVGGSGVSGTSTTPQRVGSAPRIPAGAVRTGAPAGSTPVELSVGLDPRDPAALKSYATAVSTKGNAQYHHYLAKGQFASTFGPTQSAIDDVTAALKAQGLQPGKVSADGLSIPVTTTLSAAASAFGTSFSSYRLADGTTSFANTTAPQLSGAVAGEVSGVAGLNTLTQRQADHTAPATSGDKSTAPAKGSGSRTTAAAGVTGPQLCAAATTALGNDALGSDGNGYYSAGSLAAAYGMAHTATSGAGVTVGVFEMEKYSASDLAAYQACYGTHVPVTVDALDGGPKLAPNPSKNIGVESLLDLEDVAGLAPGASVIDYEGPDLSTATDAQWLATFQGMVLDDRAQVLSISYGGCELYTSSDVLNAEEYYSEEAASQGQTIFASSGDDGAVSCFQNGGTDQNVVSVSDPASQPFVTGVGGTTLAGNPVFSREAWNNNGLQGAGATGGGVSDYWSLSSSFNYQSGFTGQGGNMTRCEPKSGYTCRQVPDVSALADPYEGYPVYIGGEWGTIGGTSGATPTWAALIANAETQTGCKANGPLGFINFSLYGAASADYSDNYTDITSGNNLLHGDSGYTAGTGYDLTTGLGEPNAVALTNTLCGMLPVAATGPGTYHAVTPKRLLDTRVGDGGLIPSSGMTGVQVEGNPAITGIPSTGVSAVVLNVTVTQTAGGGFLTAWGDGTKRPATSNLNWTAKNQTISNLVTVPVPSDGGVDFYTNSATAVIADIQGYYTNDTTGSTFTSVTPHRLMDSRSAVGISTKTPISNKTVSLKVAGLGGVPVGATAVALNLTATGTTSGGYFEAYPEGTTAPGVSNVNWAASNTTIAGLAIVPLGSDGNVSVLVHGSSHLIADVFGYYTATGDGDTFTTVNPTRLLDTRSAIGVTTKTPVASGKTVALQITGKAGVPAGIKAVVLNVTVTGTVGGGYLEAWADGATKPTASNLNWTAKSQTIPNQVIVPVGADGKVDLFVNNSTHVIADVFGYYN